jgi:hypothetical protein
MGQDRLTTFLSRVAINAPGAVINRFFLERFTGASPDEVKKMIEGGVLVDGGSELQLTEEFIRKQQEISSENSRCSTPPLIYTGYIPRPSNGCRKIPRLPGCDELPNNFLK